MILNFIHWDPNPDVFSIYDFPIKYYGLLFSGGLILSMYVLRWIFKKEKIPTENLDKLALYGIVGILVGARLGHCLFYETSYYLSNPLEMIFPISFDADGGISFIGYQGLASHGGALGLIISLFIYSKKTGLSILYTLDIIAIVTGLAGGFIRIANFFNSEIIGIPTSKPWGIIFSHIDNIPRHPAQLYEAICYFIIFIFMVILYQKGKIKLRTGFFFGLVLVLIFITRFLIEFIKENQVIFEDSMIINMGQSLSIPYIIIGLGFMIYGLKNRLT